MTIIGLEEEMSFLKFCPEVEAFIHACVCASNNLHMHEFVYLIKDHGNFTFRFCMPVYRKSQSSTRADIVSSCKYVYMMLNTSYKCAKN